MKVIEARNVNDAYQQGMLLLKAEGVRSESRNGPVIKIDGPVTTLYKNPLERVLMNKQRDANPFFHFMESLWMLNGNNDVGWISQFNSNIASFSDDGNTFHGAYGHRWRKHFGCDQLIHLAIQLGADKNSRRCVLQMWDTEVDLNRDGRDFPCNTNIYFGINNDRLDMTVSNRSNDIIWGAYGANAVHMSFLQEFMALAVGVEVGRYWQVSNNYHAYDAIFNRLFDSSQVTEENFYETIFRTDSNIKLINVDIATWLKELSTFIELGSVIGFTDPFFRRVVFPIYEAYMTYRNRDNSDRFTEAFSILEGCEATDWKLACMNWLLKREQNVQIAKHTKKN